MSIESATKYEIRYFVVKGKSSLELFNEVQTVYGEGVSRI